MQTPATGDVQQEIQQQAGKTPTRTERFSTTREKLAALKANLRDKGSLIVAYSGGVDSAFLAAVANEVLGHRALAVTSPGVAHVLPGWATKWRQVVCKG